MKIIFPLKSYQKILAYVDACKNEISGLADVDFDPLKQAFIVGEVYLLEQVVSSGSTELDGEAIAKLTHELIKKGKTQMPRLWWHSHAEMGTFWSATDDTAMDNLKNDSFTLAIEFNHAHENINKLIIHKPFEFSLDSLPIEIDFTLPEPTQAIKREIAKKVKEGLPLVSQYIGEAGGGFKKMGGAFPSDLRLAKTLPKNAKKADKKIEELGLELTFFNDAGVWAYKNPKTNELWLDYYDAQAYAGGDYYD